MKKRSILLFLIVLLPVMIVKVDAKNLSVNEVVNEFNKEVTEKYTILGDLKASVDNENKKVKLVSDGKESTLLNYTDTYIEYKYSGSTPTDDNLMQELYIQTVFRAFLDSLFSLADVKDYYSVKYIESYENNFDKYNVELIYTDYKYNAKNDTGETVEKDSSYTSSFKLGFDSDKINAFAENYAKSKYFNLIPKLNMILSNGDVSYNFKLHYTKKDDHDIPYCAVYRSDALDGTYTNIDDSNVLISCEERDSFVYLVDKTAVKGKTYYYKAQVVGSDKFSNILKVDLANNIITDTSNNEIIYAHSKDSDTDNKVSNDNKEEPKKEEETKKDYKNPETGEFFPMLPILILSLISIGVWSKVKNKFARV